MTTAVGAAPVPLRGWYVLLLAMLGAFGLSAAALTSGGSPKRNVRGRAAGARAQARGQWGTRR